MSRFSLLMGLVLVLSTAIPAFSQSALDTDMTLDLMVLRLQGDGFWTESFNPDGSSASAEFIQMAGGVPQMELVPLTAEVYAQHQVQDVIVYRNVFDAPTLERVASFVEIRILTFPDEGNAANYLASAYENQAAAAASVQSSNQIAEVSSPPRFDYPIIGWTQMDEYIDEDTEEFTGFASSIRYMAQVGRAIVSAQVTGPFVDFNFDLAHALLGLQADCLMSGVPCEPVTLQQATPAWQVQPDGTLGFQPEGSLPVPARWLWPVQEPVREPEMSATNAATPTANQERTSGSMHRVFSP